MQIAATLKTSTPYPRQRGTLLITHNHYLQLRYSLFAGITNKEVLQMYQIYLFKAVHSYPIRPENTSHFSLSLF